MRNLIDHLISDNLQEVKNILESKLQELIYEKLGQFKLDVAEEMFSEANIQKMGRTKIVRARVRAGKIQRKKKLSNVRGYVVRNGKVVRMSTQEKLHRKQGARRAKFKRKAKLQTSLRKRTRSLRKRKSLGIK